MAKKATEPEAAELVEAPAPEPEPALEPGKVKIALMDEHERVKQGELIVDAMARDRVYYHDGMAYAASRPTGDQSWIYRKEVH